MRILILYLLFFGFINASLPSEETNISFIDFKKAIIKNDLDIIHSFKSKKGIDDIESINVNSSMHNLTYEMYAFYNKCNFKTLKYLLDSSKNILNLDNENHSIIFYFGHYCLDCYSEDIFNHLFTALVACIDERRLLIRNIISLKGIVPGYTKEDLVLKLHILLYKLKQFQQSLNSDLEQLKIALPEIIYLRIKDDLVKEIDDKILKLISIFETNKHFFSCMNLYMQAVEKDDIFFLEDLFSNENKAFLDLDEASKTVFYYLSLKCCEPDVKLLSCLCDGIRGVISSTLLKITTPQAMEEFHARLYKFNSKFIIDIQAFSKHDKARELLSSFHQFIIDNIKSCELQIDFNVIAKIRKIVESAQLSNPINIKIVESFKLKKLDYSHFKELAKDSKIVNDIKDSAEEQIKYFDEMSPVLLALFLGEWDIAQILLENGASIYSNAGCKYLLADALFMAIASRNLDTVEKISDYISQSIGLKGFIEKFVLKKRYGGALGNATVSNNMLEILQNIIMSRIRLKKSKEFYENVLDIIIMKLKAYIYIEKGLRNLSVEQESFADKILAVSTLEDMLDLKVSLREFLSLPLASIKVG